MKLLKVLLLFGTVALLSSCGKDGFAPANLANTTTDDSNNTHDNNPAEPPNFDSGELNGGVVGGPTNNHTAIFYDISEHAILIRVPVAGATGTVDTTIPNVPGSRVYMDYSNPILPVLVVSVPGMYVLGHLGFEPGQVGLNPRLLPNGQAIPMTPGGEPPRVSFLVPKINQVVQVYLGLNVVAVFVESPFDPRADLTFPIRNKSRIETIGYFSTVRRRAPFNGGFFVSMTMPTRIAGLLDDYLSKILLP